MLDPQEITTRCYDNPQKYADELDNLGLLEIMAASEMSRIKFLTAEQIEKGYRHFVRESTFGDIPEFFRLADEKRKQFVFDPRVLSDATLFGLIYQQMLMDVDKNVGSNDEDYTCIIGASYLPYFFHMWEKDKIVYHVTKSLWDACKNMDYPKDFPLSQLTFPSDFGVWLTPDGPMYHCFEQIRPSMPVRLAIHTFFPYGSSRREKYRFKSRQAKRLFEKLTDEAKFNTHSAFTINLDSKTIGSNFISEVPDHLADIAAALKPGKKLEHRSVSKPFLNLMYYLSGQEDICRKIGSWREEKAPRRSKGRPEPRLAPVREFTVGERHDAILKHIDLLEKEKGEKGEETGRRLAPHMRSGHFKTVWVGKNRAEARKVFISPYATGGLTMADFPSDKDYFSVLVK